MRFRSRQLGATILVMISLAVGALGGGCSGKGIEQTDPAELYKDAEEDIENNRYQIAVEKLRTVKNKFPYSKYATDAQLRLADVYFLQESFAEAAQAYQAFADLHPRHPRVSYALFRVGLSHYNDSPGTVARDLGPAQKALEAFESFLRRFPNGPEAQEAREKANESRKMLAEKELYVANFYFKRSIWDSARLRFEKIVALYPETEAAQEAKAKLPQAEQGAREEKERRAREEEEEARKKRAS